MFKFTVEKVMVSGKIVKGCDYFKTLSAANKSRSSYVSRGFTVGNIESTEPDEATFVAFLS